MTKRLRQNFIKGLALLFPTLITVIILVKAWDFIDKTAGKPITKAMLYVLTHYLGVERESIGNTWYLTVIGFSLAALGVFLIGLLVATFIGRSLFRYFEKLFDTIPVIRVIYPYAKQVTEFFASEDKTEFDSVVIVEYPRPGIFSIGFVTGKGLKPIMKYVGEEMMSVFMPSSPTPITGYVVNVPKSRMRKMNMSVEEALRFIVSGGVLIPPSQVISGGVALNKDAHIGLDTVTLRKEDILKK